MRRHMLAVAAVAIAFLICAVHGEPVEVGDAQGVACEAAAPRDSSFIVRWIPFLSILDEGVAVHTVIYSSMVIAIIFLLCQKSYRPERPVVLTDAEIDECIDEYSPQPLVPVGGSEQMELDRKSVLQLDSAMDVRVRVSGCEEPVVNMAGFNFLGFANDQRTKEAAKAAVKKYGPGSCGPRQFYGTFDCHLKFEDLMASFVGTEASILYSSGLATITSAISAFSKRGDVLLIDGACRHGIQIGASLSRSQVVYYEHVDMNSLEEEMRKVAERQAKKKKKSRCYVVTEGLFLNTANVAPLAEISQLCKKYKFRIILDDSFGMGILGGQGHGSIEHHRMSNSEVDIYLADTGVCFTTIGGICAGKLKVTNHQRLNGSGYCFSASNPPYYVCSGIAAVEEVMERPERVSRLQERAYQLRTLLADVNHIEVLGYARAPIVPVVLGPTFAHLSAIQQDRILQRVVDLALTRGVALTRAKTVGSMKNRPPPSIRITVTSEHSSSLVDSAAAIIKECFGEVLGAAAEEL